MRALSLWNACRKARQYFFHRVYFYMESRLFLFFRQDPVDAVSHFLNNPLVSGNLFLYYFSLLMAVELVLVVLGAFLIGVASAGAEHRLWQRLGNAAGRGSKPLRLVVGAIGTVIMILPFVLLGFEAYSRWMTIFEYFGYSFQ